MSCTESKLTVDKVKQPPFGRAAESELSQLLQEKQIFLSPFVHLRRGIKVERGSLRGTSLTVTVKEAFKSTVFEQDIDCRQGLCVVNTFVFNLILFFL